MFFLRPIVHPEETFDIKSYLEPFQFCFLKKKQKKKTLLNQFPDKEYKEKFFFLNHISSCLLSS